MSEIGALPDMTALTAGVMLLASWLAMMGSRIFDGLWRGKAAISLIWTLAVLTVPAGFVPGYADKPVSGGDPDVLAVHFLANEGVVAGGGGHRVVVDFPYFLNEDWCQTLEEDRLDKKTDFRPGGVAVVPYRFGSDDTNWRPFIVGKDRLGRLMEKRLETDFLSLSMSQKPSFL